jgi:hypothetical protein
MQSEFRRKSLAQEQDAAVAKVTAKNIRAVDAARRGVLF